MGPCGAGFFPKTPCDFQRIDLYAFPPSDFIAGLMQLSMMPTAERHGELIADFETDGSRLCKAQVMGIGRLPAADKAWLGGNEFQVCLVPQSFGLCDHELAFVDLGRSEFCCGGRQRWGCHGVFLSFCLILAEQVCHGAIMPPPVVVRRS